MSYKLISVIVPAFNSADYIIQNLMSIHDQTYEDWECIIVNDGSTDNTKDIVENYIQNDERFRLISTENSGVSAARNTAIRNSNGRFIFPLDSDNYMERNCLSKCMDEFDKNDNLKLVYTEASLVGESTGLWNLATFHYKTMLKYNMIDNSAMYLRADFDRVGGYRTNMVHGLEDWDFFIALLYGYSENQVLKIQEPLYSYRVSEKGRRTTVEKSGRQNEMLDLMVYNNFKIYQQYFPDIFSRIHAYDFDKTLLNKPSVRVFTSVLLAASSLKNRIFSNRKS